MSSIRVDYDILNQKQTPAFYASSLATRPAFGFPGRIFIDTDTPSSGIYRDTGSAWVQVADPGAGTTGTLQQVTTNGKTTNQGINITTGGLTLGTPSGDNQILLNLPATNQLIYREGVGSLYGFNIEPSDNSFFLTNTEGGYYQTLYFGDAETANIFGLSASNDLGLTWNPILVVNQDNKVGINKNNPTTALDVLGDGVFSGKLAVGTTAIPAGFSNTKLYAGLAAPLETHIYEIGVTGTATANISNVNIWGIGVYGAGFTNGATRSAGIQGDGEVTASADTGTAIGVRGYATATHSGGLNIGILSDASGSSTGNYGFYNNMASATNTYAVYTAGTAFSCFNGYVGLGTLLPNSRLEVTSRIIASDGGGASRVALNIESNTTSSSFSAINSYNYGTLTGRALAINESGGNVMINSIIDDTINKFQVTGNSKFTGIINTTSRANFNAATDNALFSLNSGGTLYTVGFSPNATASSTNTLTLTTAQTTWIYTGTGLATWTLPNPSGTNQMFWIKNAGTGIITLNAFAGTNIIDNSATSVSSITIAVGATALIQQDGNVKSYQLQ